jgi:PAS domain S-box-containing protein
MRVPGAERALADVLGRVRESPESVAEILAAEAGALFAFTADRTIVAANVAGEAFFGYGRHELDGRNTQELVPARLRQPDVPPLLPTSDLTTVHPAGLRRDGSEVAAVWTFASVPGPRAAMFVMLVRDRAQFDEELERTLQRSDARYRALLLASAAIVWNTNAAGEFVELQPAWESYTGQRWEDYRGSKWISGVHPDDRPRVMADWTAAVRAGSAVYRTQGRVWSAPHEAWRAFQTRAVSVRNANGEIVEWVGALTDVQDVLDAQERLRESETRYSVLFEKSWLPLALTRMPDRVTVAVNEAFLRLFEVSRDEVIGRTSVDLGLATEEEREAVASMLRERGSVRDFECTRRTATGREVRVALNLDNLVIGGHEHVLATVQDISHRAAQEAALARAMTDERHARNAAEAANRAKDEFLATMSHELRTPLNAMLGWASVLRTCPADEAKVARGLEIIERNARTQERIVSDLLDMSRIISGKLKLTLSRTPLWDVVCAAAEVVRPAAEGKGVRLLLDLDPDIGVLIADQARLQQVVWNLLANAVKYTPRGGRVVVSGERSGSTLRLRVQDTGAGVAPEHLPRIFDRFRQVDSSTTRVHGGLGLGLAIVRHIVEAHGGSVDARSDGVGEGATFSLELPIRAIDNSDAEEGSVGAREEAARRQRTPLPPATNLESVRVLVVEDDSDSLGLVRELLESAGARVIAAASARAALAVTDPYDVIVSDIGMAEMDGYAMLKELRARGGESVPAIALTAYARAEDAHQARRAGFQEHLSKPVDPGRLLDAIARWNTASVTG